MFRKTSRIVFVAILFFALVLISGCSFFGGKTEENKNTNQNTEGDKAEVSSDDQSLPKPTGKVEDIVSSIDSEAAGENNLAKEEDDTAKNSASDDQETNDFNQIYNENEF